MLLTLVQQNVRRTSNLISRRGKKNLPKDDVDERNKKWIETKDMVKLMWAFGREEKFLSFKLFLDREQFYISSSTSSPIIFKKKKNSACAVLEENYFCHRNRTDRYIQWLISAE